MVATTPTPTLSPTPSIEVSASILEVGHLVDVVTTLTVQEPDSPMISTKSAREEEHPSPQTDASLKRTRVAEDDHSREETPFI